MAYSAPILNFSGSNSTRKGVTNSIQQMSNSWDREQEAQRTFLLKQQEAADNKIYRDKLLAQQNRAQDFVENKDAIALAAKQAQGVELNKAMSLANQELGQLYFTSGMQDEQREFIQGTDAYKNVTPQKLDVDTLANIETTMGGGEAAKEQQAIIAKSLAANGLLNETNQAHRSSFDFLDPNVYRAKMAEVLRANGVPEKDIDARVKALTDAKYGVLTAAQVQAAQMATPSMPSNKLLEGASTGTGYRGTKGKLRGDPADVGGNVNAMDKLFDNSKGTFNFYTSPIDTLGAALGFKDYPTREKDINYFKQVGNVQGISSDSMAYTLNQYISDGNELVDLANSDVRKAIIQSAKDEDTRRYGGSTATSRANGQALLSSYNKQYKTATDYNKKLAARMTASATTEKERNDQLLNVFMERAGMVNTPKGGKGGKPEGDKKDKGMLGGKDKPRSNTKEILSKYADNVKTNISNTEKFNTGLPDFTKSEELGNKPKKDTLTGNKIGRSKRSYTGNQGNSDTPSKLLGNAIEAVSNRRSSTGGRSSPATITDRKVHRNSRSNTSSNEAQVDLLKTQKDSARKDNMLLSAEKYKMTGGLSDKQKEIHSRLNDSDKANYIKLTKYLSSGNTTFKERIQAIKEISRLNKSVTK